MSEAQLKARVAELERQIKERDEAKVSFKLTDAGYIQINGLTAVSWKGLSLLPKTIYQLAEFMPQFVDYAKRNEARSDQLNAAYRALKATG